VRLSSANTNTDRVREREIFVSAEKGTNLGSNESDSDLRSEDGSDAVEKVYAGDGRNDD
jgi:hypothetical protein